MTHYLLSGPKAVIYVKVSAIPTGLHIIEINIHPDVIPTMVEAAARENYLDAYRQMKYVNVYDRRFIKITWHMSVKNGDEKYLRAIAEVHRRRAAKQISVLPQIIMRYPEATKAKGLGSHS